MVLNTMLNKFVIFVFIILVSITSTYSQKVTIGVSQSIPPYFFKDNSKGIEFEILKEAFKVKGHTIRIQYLPLARTFREFKKGSIDGVINVKKGMVEDAFYSDFVISFQNSAISLAKRKFPDFHDLNFLEGKSIIAFQMATIILGKKFGSIVKRSNKYEETAKQITQVYRLFMERDVDFVVMDKRIFKYYRKQAYDMIGDKVNLQVKFHDVFPATSYRFAFLDENIRNDFNFGLKIIKKNNVYNKILKKYE